MDKKTEFGDDFDLLMELHHERGAAVLAHDFVLTAVAADAAQRDAGDPGPEQRRLDLRQPLRPHDGSDQFHGHLGGILSPKIPYRLHA